MFWAQTKEALEKLDSKLHNSLTSDFYYLKRLNFDSLVLPLFRLLTA